jgi:uncharacterized membrane protein
MPMFELAAVGAATCWALTGLLSAGPAGYLGALAFNRTRQLFVAFLLGLYVLASGTWQEFQPEVLWPILLSGFIGIFVGDTLLFTCLNRLGPRRSGILFALNAPIAALLGWAVLGEQLTGTAVAGIGLTLCGVLPRSPRSAPVLRRRARGSSSTDMNGEGAEATVSQIAAEGGKARAFASDISTAEGCRAIVDNVMAAEGRIDVLCNMG